MTSKKSANSKRATLPRSSDRTKSFSKDWERLSHSGRYDMRQLKVAMMRLSAIDHIDIMTEGASATYGSDAVGAVVNIVTISDYSGIEVTAGYGGTSDDKLVGPGGGVTTGGSWSGGKGVMTFDYEGDEAIRVAVIVRP